MKEDDTTQIENHSFVPWVRGCSQTPAGAVCDVCRRTIMALIVMTPAAEEYRTCILIHLGYCRVPQMGDRQLFMLLRLELHGKGVGMCDTPPSGFPIASYVSSHGCPFVYVCGPISTFYKPKSHVGLELTHATHFTLVTFLKLPSPMIVPF